MALVLVLLLATQTVGSDLYLPALPQIAADLGRANGEVQWTLTAFVLTFGLAQLAAGPLADRYGRRRTLLCGLGLYSVAAWGAALTSDFGVLLVSRALLGAGTAACVVGARAVIRDSYPGASGLRVMARTMTGMAAIGACAPLLGGWAAQYLGWHAANAAVACFGMLAWLTVYRGLADSHVRSAGSGVVASGGFGDFLATPQFVYSSLLAGLSYSGALVFLVLSPFVFISQFGMSRVAYGLLPAACTLSFLCGTVLCRQALRRWSVPHTVRIGACLSLLGGAAQLALWRSPWHSVWTLAIPQCVFMLGHGFHQPCGQGGAVAPFPSKAGRAAALSGCIITGLAFMAGQLASASTWPPAETLVACMAGLSALIGVTAFGAIPRAYRLATP
ncbi:multidrug effflux MFS transporter [Duganella guangzhouensis]|nr:multidrug effflux MFS transporter [Duganella guangzhouensis]